MSFPPRSARPTATRSREVARLVKRSLQLTAPEASQLIRDAVAAGGELWVSGSGQSMHPTVRHADPVLLAPLRGPVRRGDVVLVPLGPRLMLHRVVRVDRDAVITRGDARPRADAPIPRAAVIARAVAVRRDALVTPLTLTTRFGFASLVRFLFEGARRARIVRATVHRLVGKQRDG
jgi:hypothetical protein